MASLENFKLIKLSHVKAAFTYFLPLFFTLFTARVLAQDVSFSQPYAQPLYLNPAYSGVEQFSRVGAGFRYQWGQLGAPYTTYALYADHYFDEWSSGVGIMAVSDRQPNGALLQTSLGASYAYNLRLAQETFVRFGLQALLGLTAIRPASLVFPDMLDEYGNPVGAAEAYAAEQKAYFDMAVGAVFSHRMLYAGVALQHLMGRPEQQVMGQPVGVPRKLTLHGGLNIPIGLRRQFAGSYRGELTGSLTISPSVICLFQDDYKNYAVGSYLNLKGFSAGFFYKSEMASSASFFSLSAGYGGRTWGFMYTFDFGRLSREAKVYAANTHEFSLMFKIQNLSRSATRLRGNSGHRVLNTPLL